MKKIIFILIAIFTCFHLTGCTPKDSFVISFDDGGSSSYSWSYKVSNEDIIDITNTHDNSRCEPDLDGCVGLEIYTVKALKPGTVTLTFEFSSFIDEEEEPSYIAIYEITVDDDLNITETHYGSYFDIISAIR